MNERFAIFIKIGAIENKITYNRKNYTSLNGAVYIQKILMKINIYNFLKTDSEIIIIYKKNLVSYYFSFYIEISYNLKIMLVQEVH